jgi:hypothetical protein
MVLFGSKLKEKEREVKKRAARSMANAETEADAPKEGSKRGNHERVRIAACKACSSVERQAAGNRPWSCMGHRGTRRY